MPCQSRVAVLVATCNRPGLLAQRSLTAIQRQTRRPDFLVVVDDSDAPQRGDNRNIVNDLRLHGARIVYLTNTRTQGASGAWNTGLDWLRRHAGDPRRLFVAVLDDDDEWTPDHLRNCTAAADAQGLDMVAAGLIRITTDAPDRVQVPPSALEPDLFLVGNPHIQGSNLFVRLSAFLEAGGFDESLLSCTDRDLCIRLADLGWVRYDALSIPTVRHHADAARPRLSSPTNDPKRRGLDRFWSKWCGRMSEAQRRVCSDRAKSYFGWTPPEALEAPMFPVGPLVPSRDPTDVEKAHADDLVLVVGVIADDYHAEQFARLLDDLLTLQSFDQICCLDVVVLLNGATTGSVERAVAVYRDRGLTVFLATEERQTADAVSGRFGAGFARPAGRAPIGPARTMHQAYVTRVASQRNGAIAWILDDDSRLDNRTDHGDAPVFEPFLASLGKMRALGVDVVLGSITGDPPVPPGSTVRTQLVDLYHNLAWLAGLDPGAALPDRRADNRAARAAARDYYYDLSRRDTHHLEWPFWLTPSQPGELVGNAFSRMVEALPRILAGQGVFRPLLLASSYDAIMSMRPSVQRGTNTFVFDCAAFAAFPNLAPRFAGDVLRRSDMIWALLNRYAGGRRLVSATLPVRHDRSSEPPVGLDLGRLVGDIRGYALYSALEDVLVRRRERRLRDGVGAETPDDLQFRDGDLDLAVARFRKYLVERTAALLWSCWRIRGVCRALLDLAAGRTFEGAFFHRDPLWKDRLAALSEFLERTREQFDTQRVEHVVAGVIDVPPEQVREFLRSLQSAVAAHRTATAAAAVDEWFHAERVASAAPLARAAADGAQLRLLGTGGEGVVFAASGSAVKVIDYSKRSAANGAWKGMEQLVAQDSQDGPLCRCSMPRVPCGRVVIRRPLEEGEQYRGGGASDILAILRALRQAGVVTTNFHPKNLLSTPSGVRLIDYGSDIRPFSEQGFRSMVQRAWLTMRFAERDDLSQLMRRALEDEALPELEGWQALFAAIDPPAKREVVDDAILDLVRQLRPRRVLDFGCGHGRLAAALASEGIEVVAFDPDEAMRDRWQKLHGGGGEKVRWFTGVAAEALAASPGAFDVVVCSLVLCVIEDQAEYEAAISALAKSLAPGGRCVILVCNPDSTLAGDSTLQRRLVPVGSAAVRTFTWTKELPSGVRRSELLTGPRKRAGFALRPGRFPASGRGGGNDGDSGVKRGSGLAAALSVCVGPIGLRQEPPGFPSPSRPNLSNSLRLSVSALADLTRGSDRGWAWIGTVLKRRDPHSTETAGGQPMGYGSPVAAVSTEELVIVEPQRNAMQVSWPLAFLESAPPDASDHRGENQIVRHEQMHARWFGAEKRACQREELCRSQVWVGESRQLFAKSQLPCGRMKSACHQFGHGEITVHDVSARVPQQLIMHGCARPFRSGKHRGSGIDAPWHWAASHCNQPIRKQCPHRFCFAPPIGRQWSIMPWKRIGRHRLPLTVADEHDEAAAIPPGLNIHDVGGDVHWWP